jgi:hypothetical protein
MMPLDFPPHPLTEWKETRDTLQKYCRMVGAIREVMSLPLPHSMQTNLLVSEFGFTTSSLIKNAFPPVQTFELLIDLVNRRLRVESNYREPLYVALTGQSLNALCDETCSLLSDIGISPPLEKPSFFEGSRGRFEPEPLANYWKAVKTINQLLTKIKNEMTGETSPVQLRPDDLALILTIFDKVIKERNSSFTEQIEFGFSTGDEFVPDAHLYISIYPDSELIDKFVADSYLIKLKGRLSRAVFPFHKLVESGDLLKTAADFFQKISI